MDFEYETKMKKNMVYFYVDGMKINGVPKEVLKNIMSFGGEMEYYVETGIYSQSEGNCCVKNMEDYIGRIRRKP
jgi:hypothetical protein